MGRFAAAYSRLQYTVIYAMHVRSAYIQKQRTDDISRKKGEKGKDDGKERERGREERNLCRSRGESRVYSTRVST